LKNEQTFNLTGEARYLMGDIDRLCRNFNFNLYGFDSFHVRSRY